MNERALIIVPHQDDEVNLAGNIIDIIKEKYDLYILYSSIDPVPEKGKIRKKEALEACSIWDIDIDHIIFLDYPDTSNKQGHHFYSDGDHRIVDDLKKWILKLRPDVIFATDFDYHADHRMLSIAFETSMGQILKECVDLHPIVLKGFCYETAYYSVEDYKASDPGNSVSNMDPLSNPSYEWEKRISIRSSEKRGVIWKRKAYRALEKHKSQYTVLHARSIINQDNVFWLRRTDNLLNQAELLSSVDDIEKIRDFKILDTDDLITKDPRGIDYSNSTVKMRKGDWIKAEWSDPVEIDRIVIHGGIDQSEKSDIKIEVLVNGEPVTEVRELSPYGRDTVIEIMLDNVHSLEFASYNDVAISEIEVLEKKVAYLFEVDITKKNERRVCMIDVIDRSVYQFIVFFTKVMRKLKFS